MPAEKVGPYVLGRTIGGGGQGVVYCARRDDDQSDVALKTISLGFNEQQEEVVRKRVMRELRVLTDFWHPAIVMLKDVGEDPEAGGSQCPRGLVYLAYELVEGPTLRAWMNTHVPSFEDAAHLSRALCDGLGLLHEKSVIHRDIKPDNVMLRNGDPSDPVLIDFMTVRHADMSRMTRTELALGTYTYMAPEVKKDSKSVSVQSDVWSLAATLVEPFSLAAGADKEDVFVEQRAQALLALPCWKTFTATRVSVFERALVEDVNSRTRSAGDFARALEGALAVDGTGVTPVVSLGVDAEALCRVASALELTPGTPPLRVHAKSPGEIFLAPGGKEEYYENPQLAFWAGTRGETWVGILARSKTGTVRFESALARPAVQRLLVDLRAVLRRAVWDRDELTGAPRQRLVPLLESLPTDVTRPGPTGSSNDSHADPLGLPETRPRRSRLGIAVAHHRALTPKELAGLRRGDLGPIAGLAKLWLAMIAAE